MQHNSGDTAAVSRLLSTSTIRMQQL